MSKLCIMLPPLAPDYSGAASALFELGGMIVIHDAAGCTGNYTGYDEPRWLGSHTAVYCSGLRHMDAILGNDDLLIERIKKAADSIKPNFIALLGSPVPMVIGTDFEGVASEIEHTCGIPSIGLSTRGLSYYGKGVNSAIISLMKKVCPSSVSDNEKNDGINILGMTPLDFAKGPNASDFVKLFEDNGIKVNCCFTMGCTFEEFKASVKSRLNVVVSQSGYDTAVYMKEKYGIPFVVGTPMLMGMQILAKSQPEKFSFNPKPLTNITDKKIFIAGEQVIANTIREYFEALGLSKEKATVGIMFDATKELMREGDVIVKDEKHLRDLLNSGKYQKVVADPLVEQLITKETKETGIEFYGLPHVAVSSKVYWDKPVRFISKEFTSFIKSVITGN
ncbi:MAG: nitrogenase component 1 [Treponema sp.]|nr:nitrogenase component 1 [Treponema sp.]